MPVVLTLRGGPEECLVEREWMRWESMLDPDPEPELELEPEHDPDPELKPDLDPDPDPGGPSLSPSTAWHDSWARP